LSPLRPKNGDPQNNCPGWLKPCRRAERPGQHNGPGVSCKLAKARGSPHNNRNPKAGEQTQEKIGFFVLGFLVFWFPAKKETPLNLFPGTTSSGVFVGGEGAKGPWKKKTYPDTRKCSPTNRKKGAPRVHGRIHGKVLGRDRPPFFCKNVARPPPWVAATKPGLYPAGQKTLFFFFFFFFFYFIFFFGFCFFPPYGGPPFSKKNPPRPAPPPPPTKSSRIGKRKPPPLFLAITPSPR